VTTRTAPTWGSAVVLVALAGSSAALVGPLPHASAMAVGLEAAQTAACAQMIYSGSRPSAVLRTRHDVVVGPVRFDDLDPRLVGKIGGSALLGIKSPMTVGPTRFPALLVSVRGTKGFVSIVYGQAPSSTTTTPAQLRAEFDRIVVQTPMSCGLPATGFVQYGGGFALAQRQCVTVTVSVPTGHVLGQRTVPLGLVKCAPKS